MPRYPQENKLDTRGMIFTLGTSLSADHVYHAFHHNLSIKKQQFPANHAKISHKTPQIKSATSYSQTALQAKNTEIPTSVAYTYEKPKR